MQQRIGNYEIIDRIAFGGMAEIFLARLLGPAGFEKTVALKRLLPNLAADATCRQMFLDEARLAARLSHDKIVRISDLGQDGDSYFLVMDYLVGVNLGQLLGACAQQETLLPEVICAKIIADAADGLHYAHTLAGSRGEPLHIVHRDVNPQNIFITSQGSVKMVDFGIAKAADKVVKTEVGTVRGKLAYMAPEQLRSEPVDARTDIFALGVTLFETLSASRMLRGNSYSDILRLIDQGELPDLRERVPQVSEQAVRIVKRALEIDPAQRYQSASAMQNDLEELVAAAGRGPSNRDLAQLLEQLFGTEHFAAQQRRGHSGASAQRETVQLEAGGASARRHTPPSALVVSSDASLGPQEATQSSPAIDRTIAATPSALAGPNALLEPGTSPTLLTLTPGRRVRNALAIVILLALALATAWLWRSRAPASTVDSEMPQLQTTSAGSGATTTGVDDQVPAAAVAPHADAAAQDALIAVARDAGAVVDDKLEVSSARSRRAASKPSPRSPLGNKRPKRHGTLSLSSNVALDVYLKGRLLGATPLREVVLPAGAHTLVLLNSGEGIEHVLPLRMGSGQQLTRRVELGKGRLSIEVRPWANVFIRGVKFGTTPILRRPIWQGTHQLVLRNPDLDVEKKITVTVTRDQTTVVREALP